MKTSESTKDFHSILKTLGSDLTAKFNLPVAFNPEDQLKGSVGDLISSAGQMMKLKIVDLQKD